jgi:hypothetical protein
LNNYKANDGNYKNDDINSPLFQNLKLLLMIGFKDTQSKDVSELINEEADRS